MKICAVITEYNPFHNGHLKQIEYIREHLPDTAIVAIMSGNIVQRGELAVLDKYTRAHCAVLCGADAVLELPYPWCGGSAGYFARGAVDIAKGIGADYLCFGSESGDIEELKSAAERISSKEYTEHLDSLVKEEQDTSYISLSRRAYRELYGCDIPDGANNTLAIEYLKNTGDIIPVTYKRTFPSSATAAREYYRNGLADDFKSTVPSEVLDLYESNTPISNDCIGDIVLWRLCNATKEELCGYADIDMGIASRLISSALESDTYDTLMEKAASKKYTNSRLRRCVLNILLGTTKDRLEEIPAYTTLLAANQTGCKAVKQIKKQGSITVITKPADHDGVEAQFEFSSKADKLFLIAKGLPVSKIFKNKPVIL
ncbi:MAG: nucleotidyltransferase family protein [Clostridia bacterium]|nr:nucleotidyltransferase family protein [Clostridia bacterium]